jgi:zinc transporter ZupT
MRHGYWWIEALLGVVLIIAPFLGEYTELRTATYTDVIAGVLLLVWALVGYWYLGDMNGRAAQPTHT